MHVCCGKLGKYGNEESYDKNKMILFPTTQRAVDNLACFLLDLFLGIAFCLFVFVFRRLECTVYAVCYQSSHLNDKYFSMLAVSL